MLNDLYSTFLKLKATVQSEHEINQKQKIINKWSETKFKGDYYRSQVY